MRVCERKGEIKSEKKDSIKEEAKSSENARVEDARARGRREILKRASEKIKKKRRKLKKQNVRTNIDTVFVF